MQRLLDAVTEAPAWVANQRKDVLATNALARALMAPMFDDPSNQNNLARFTFFSPASRSFRAGSDISRMNASYPSRPASA